MADEYGSDEVRREAHLRRLGTRNPRCSVPGCSETRPEALTGVHPHILCYEHAALRDGRATVEGQHPQGQRNDPEATVPMAGNDHRVWDDAKRDWPERTLRNPDGSPLLKIASGIRSLLDFLRLLFEKLLGWAPAFLERLDEALRSHFGDKWWESLGLGEA